MELKQAYIRAFGNRENRTIDFKEGINDFLENNGEGKTTLANYLLARFYGLGKVSSPERKRYLPYSGKDCGGSLEFPDNGSDYRIERHFGKRPNEDTRRLFCNTKEVEINGEIGNFFFPGLDRESFCKLVFLTPENLIIESTESIDSKRGHYTDGTDENYTFDDVITALSNLQKEYKPKRNGQKQGKIAQCRDKINALEERKENRKAKQLGLEQSYSELNGLKKSIVEKKKERDEIIQKKNTIEIYHSFLDKKKQVEEARAAAEKEKSAFPCGVPSEDEIRKAEDAFSRKKAAIENQNHSSLASWEEAKYQSLKEDFKEGVPSQEDFDKISKQIYQCQTLKEERNKSPFTEEEKKVLSYYEENPIPREEIKAAYQEYKDAKKNYIPKPETENNKKGSNSKLFFILLAVAFAVLGILLGIIVSKWFFLILGLTLISIVGAFLSKGKKTAEPSLDLDKEKLDKAKEEIKKLLRIQGDDIEEAYGRIESNYGHYRDLLSKKDRADRKTKEDKETLSSTLESLNEFFGKYNLYSNNYEENLKSLKQSVSNLEDFQKKEEAYSKQKEESEKAINEYDNQINAFLNKYNLSSLKGLSLAISDYNSALQFYDKSKKVLEDYINEKKLDPNWKRENAELMDISSLNGEIDDLVKQENTLEQQISETEDTLSQWDNELTLLPDLKATLTQLKEKEQRIGKTIDYLNKAEANIKNRYIKPRHDRFIHYSDRIEKTRGDKIRFNTDFAVSIDESGASQDYNHLSSGQTALVLLCYTLALNDSIFKEDKPFLIRDDLFRYLDEEHLKKARILRNEISKERQIIYFTCHSSRNL